MSTSRAFIMGVSAHELTSVERSFIQETQPWAFILFGRNVNTPDQVTRLISDLRDAVGTQALVFVDQEGGRVQRLGPPHWPKYPPARRIAELYREDESAGLEAAWLSGRLLAEDLLSIGLTADCFPVADIGFPDAHDVIGDRAYGTSADVVIALADAAAKGLMAGGVQPVVKHIPGHGRATVDSHFKLPEVATDPSILSETDFKPFKALNHLPMAMTAHVVFRALDPENPATTSAKVISSAIRGDIGFDNLLMSDDVSMNALSGTIAERSRASIAAGCDIVLHCNGNLAEMRDVADSVPMLDGEPARRALSAASLPMAIPTDIAAARDRFGRLLDS